MPVYLLHGFRWPRPLIRVHIILQNIDDAAPEWLIRPGSPESLIQNFRQLYPDAMSSLNHLRFIEQYDPLDESIKNQPYAYVADVVHEVQLSEDVDDHRDRNISKEQTEALIALRNNLCPTEKISWFVVVCGDEERWAPPLDTPSEEFFYDDETKRGYGSEQRRQKLGSQSQSTLSREAREISEKSKSRVRRSRSISASIRKIFGRKEAREIDSISHESNNPKEAETWVPPPLPARER